MGVSRENLYAEVWAEPMTTVAKRYGVSSSFLARVCGRLNVPRPARGYWARLEFGKKVEQPALPEPRPGDELEWGRDGEEAIRVPSALPEPPTTRRRAKRVETNAVESGHPLLVDVREHFENARLNEVGHLRPRKFLLPDLFVTKAALPRALDLATELYQSLEAHGHRVALAPRDIAYVRPDVDYREQPGAYELGRWYLWSPRLPTVAFVGTVAIGLTLYELSEHVEVYHANGQYVRVDSLPEPKRQRVLAREWIHKRDMATGRFALRAYSPYPNTSWQQTWREEAVGDLQAKFASIEKELRRAAPAIAGMVAEARAKAEREYEKWQAQHREWEREEEARKREEDERRRLVARKASRDEILAIVERWALAHHVESFLADAERQAEGLPEEERAPLLGRVADARALIGNLNALERLRRWKAPDAPKHTQGGREDC